MSERQVLLVRADASTQIGTGHVMRCLALAEAWQDRGGRAIFVQAMESPLLTARLANGGCAVERLAVAPGSPEDAGQTVALARQGAACCVVVDGYHFDAAYQHALKQAGLRLLIVDDTGQTGPYAADWVLNQNIYATPALYPDRAPYTQLLLGTRYALLRREFRRWRGQPRATAPDGRRVLVSLGGSDSENVTGKVIEALSAAELAGLEVVVVVGGSNPHRAALQAQIQGQPGFRLVHNVTDMPALMAWADMAISAGGSTCWELAFMGLPSLLVVLADNQRPIAAGLAARGAAIDLGWHADLTPQAIACAVAELSAAPALRAEMAAQMHNLVDGRGAMRVVEAIQPPPVLTLRAAGLPDCALVWEWANDPVTRAASFSPEPIPWPQHVAWFEGRLADPHHRFYIALDADAQPVGQIRYQLAGAEATVSVALAPAQRGRGFGSQIVGLGSEEIFKTTQARLIHAYIKPDNLASARAFERAGFAHTGTAEAGGQIALHLVYPKEEPQ